MKDRLSVEMRHVLDQLGVAQNTISESEKKQLDEIGFLRFENFIAPRVLETLRKKTDELVVAEGDHAGDELVGSANVKHPKELGAIRLANLANKLQPFAQRQFHPFAVSVDRHSIDVLHDKVGNAVIGYVGIVESGNIRVFE